MKKRVVEFQDYLSLAGYEVPAQEYQRLAQPLVKYSLHGGSRLEFPATLETMRDLCSFSTYKKVKVTIILEEVE